MLQGCGEELYQLLFAAVLLLLLLSGLGGAWFCWIGHCDRIPLLCRALPEVLKKKGEEERKRGKRKRGKKGDNSDSTGTRDRRARCYRLN